MHGRYAVLRGGATGLVLATVAFLALGGPPAEAQTAEPAKKKHRPPNVLIVNTDDQRAADTLQVMPRTRKWLKARGTTFTRAYATTPLCCPSRVSLFTGQYAHNHGIHLNDDPKQINERLTIERYLKRSGYYTGIVGKFVNNYPITKKPRHWHDARTTLGGYYDTVWNINGKVRKVKRYSTTFIKRQAAKFIRAREGRDRRPWFLYVAPTAPHGPIQPEPRFKKAPVGPFPSKPGFPEKDLSDKPPYLQRLVNRFPPDPSFPREVRAGQLRLLMSVDVMMGALRKRLARAKELRRTLVIFTSDNGLIWGERGNLVLKDLPYDESARVPFMMAWPGRIPAGATDDRLVANIDIVPTILDAARARGPKAGQPPLDGRSLFAPGRRGSLLLEYAGLDNRIPAWKSIISDDGRQYVATAPLPGAGGGSFREYYDRRDPQQLRNPFGNLNPLDDPSVGDLQALLQRYRDCAGASCP